MKWFLLIFILYSNDGMPALNTATYSGYSECEDARLVLMRAANVGKAFCLSVYE